MRDFAAGELTDAGYDVIEAEDAETALLLADEIKFEILFTDIRLPGPMDGWGLAAALRKINPAIRIIYSTGYASNRHQQLPGTHFMMKPYRAPDLLNAIKLLLAIGGVSVL